MRLYYKMRQLLQIATTLLQRATVITKYDVYYKLRQYKHLQAAGGQNADFPGISMFPTDCASFIINFDTLYRDAFYSLLILIEIFLKNKQN